MDLSNTALIVVDLQEGFTDPVWGERNNPDCEANVAALIAVWRAAARPLVYVRHDSVSPGSPLRPDQPGNALKAVVSGEPDLLVVKHVNSAFYGEPDLHAWLQARGVTGVAITGISRFDDATRFSWEPQQGATDYEVVRGESPRFLARGFAGKELPRAAQLTRQILQGACRRR